MSEVTKKSNISRWEFNEDELDVAEKELDVMFGFICTFDSDAYDTSVPDVEILFAMAEKEGLTFTPVQWYVLADVAANDRQWLALAKCIKNGGVLYANNVVQSVVDDYCFDQFIEVRRGDRKTFDLERLDINGISLVADAYESVGAESHSLFIRSIIMDLTAQVFRNDIGRNFQRTPDFRD